MTRHRRHAPLTLALALIGVFALPVFAEDEPKGEQAPPDKQAPATPDLSTPYGDVRTGREEARKAEAMVGVLDDLALTAYVESIGQRLARFAPGYRFDYTFRISDQSEANAFALPGGWIFVSRGALALSNSEDELANVIGHEIAHVSSRHAAAREGVTGPGFLAVLQTPWLAAYSRDLEQTADRVGQGLAAVAGYDPLGLRDFLSDLSSVERVQLGVRRTPNFLDTHPGTTQRVAEAAQRAGQIHWQPKPGFSKDRAEHLRRLDGLPVGDRASQGVFMGGRFVHPDMGFTLRFPDGWDTVNTPAAVGAISPDRRAQVVLEGGAPANNAMEAAQVWAKENQPQGVNIREVQPVKIAGREGVRLLGNVSGGPQLVVTFIPVGDTIFRLTGVSGSLSDYAAIFANVARSFRPLSPELAAQVREERLRIVEARAGETIADVVRRTGSSWPPMQAAVMNGMRGDEVLQAGQLVKVAISEPYHPKPRGAGAGSPPRPEPLGAPQNH